MSGAVDCDVLIVGGGLVGAALARALVTIPVRVALVEARDAKKLEQPSFDGRATALANGSRRILEALDIWPALQPEAQPIRTIHIGERGRFGAARIEAHEEGVAALGYTVENRALGAALWDGLGEHVAQLVCFAPATLASFAADEDGVTAEIDARGARTSVRASLLIAADGADSPVRRALGIAARADDYAQAAIVVNCTTELAHAGRAFERFTRQGPLAVLPLTRGRVAVIWTLPGQAGERCMALEEADFRAQLQRAFGHRLGRFERVGGRTLHRLKRTRSDALTGARTLLVGSAAVSLHPVAGQGFNLALRDVATIAELIADDVARAPARADAGRAEILERYRAWRSRDQRNAAWFTHGLVQCFGLPLVGLGTLRGLGLVAFDLLPGAKPALARHTMGMAGRLPRLARRLKLT